MSDIPETIPNVKRVIILIEVSPEGEPKASRTRVHSVGVPGGGYKNTGLFRLEINTDPMGATLLETTAHELGHVLQRVYGAPAGNADPRNGAGPMGGKLIDMGFITESEGKAIVSAEEEAWNFGKLMFSDLRPAAAEASLKTYRDMLDPEVNALLRI